VPSAGVGGLNPKGLVAPQQDRAPQVGIQGCGAGHLDRSDWRREQPLNGDLHPRHVRFSFKSESR
jgi:hypothetical protein